MFDAYTDSLYDIFLKMPSAKQAQNGRTEITKIRDTFKQSIEYMREMCEETGINVT